MTNCTGPPGASRSSHPEPKKSPNGANLTLWRLDNGFNHMRTVLENARLRRTRGEGDQNAGPVRSGVPKGGDALSPLQQHSEGADAPLTSAPLRHSTSARTHLRFQGRPFYPGQPFCSGLNLLVQRRRVRLTLFPALRLPGVGADWLRRRAGQLRDAPGHGQREWRERKGGGTGVEDGLGRGAVGLGARIYFGTGTVSARKGDAHWSQCGTGAPPPSVL